MHAELIFTGDELLRGDTLNANQLYLGDVLLETGILTTRAVSLLDREQDIASELAASLERRASVVLLSGGLGPTPDDLTREAIASALGRPLEFREDLYERIAAVFEGYGRTMSENNRKQAYVPRGATPIDFIGTAPGFWLEEGETLVAALPGPPHELRHMWEGTLGPLLEERLATRGMAGTAVRRLRIYGTGESKLAEMLRDLPWRGRSVDVGTRTGYEGIDLILRAADDTEGNAALDVVESEVRRLLGRQVYGTGHDTPASVVGELLERHDLTIATAESCTAGLVGTLLTDRPGSSAYYLGGSIAYSNRLKTSALEVPPPLLTAHGAVSEPVARAMALGVQAATGSSCAISTTGIAGPTGGTAEKPVGLVFVGTVVQDDVRVRRLHLFRSRTEIRTRAAQTALDLFRLHLLDAFGAEEPDRGAPDPGESRA